MSRGIKFYKNKEETLEQKLTKNLEDLKAGKTTEVLPITEGYLAFLEGDEGLEFFFKKQKAKRGKENQEECFPVEEKPD
ncbi:MAG: hypothetical protein M3525_04635 [Acidobacteriota bacterium]|nr:hypothetical protein [Acidobacteriota bacterium]